MKLQDALTKIIREFGMSVLREKRLIFLLSDYKAFDDYPAVHQVMRAIVENGYGKELCRLGMDGSSDDCLNYAGRLKKILSVDKNFKPELADYAVDCILSAMGLVSSLREPSDHGFDPFGNGFGSHGQADIRNASAVAVTPDDSMEIHNDSWTSTAWTAERVLDPSGVQTQAAGTETHAGNQNQGSALAQ